MDAKTARCEGVFEAEWRKDMKDCVKACVAAGVAVAMLRKAVEKSFGRDGRSKGNGSRLGLKVEIPETGNGYHDWWAVPKIIPTA